MSDQDELKAEPLQFDEAEFAGPEASGPACAACKREIADEYYSVDGAIVCGDCRQNIAAALEGGSGVRRLVRATLFGVGAAAAGFAIYFGVMYVTNLEIGLISILVGFMVGGAVRAGSGGRGGWLYQLLAVFLVYSAIVASYGSTAILMVIKQGKVEQAAVRPPARPDANADDAVAKQAAAVKPLEDGAVTPAAEMLMGLMLIVGFLYALPIRVGFESPIGLLIIGFALWESWKINKKTPIVFTGPHRVVDEGGSLPQMAPGHV